LLDVQIHSRIAHHHIPFSSELMEKRFTWHFCLLRSIVCYRFRR
jgi:hypothetical protein